MNRVDPQSLPTTLRLAIGERSQPMKVAKRLLQTLCTLVVVPRLVSVRLQSCFLSDEAFRYASESIAGIPGLRGVYQRQAFYRHTLAHCGQDVHFGWQSVFSLSQAEVAERVYIGRFCSIGFARLEAEAMLADHVQILSGGREHSRADEARSMQQQEQRYQRVTIGRGAWIGAGAIVMADVGAGAIVGAGAVVNRPIPAHHLAAGVPARVLKPLNGNARAKGTAPTTRQTAPINSASQLR